MLNVRFNMIKSYKEWEQALLQDKYIFGFDKIETGVQMEDVFHYDKLLNMIEFYLGNKCNLLYKNDDSETMVVASIRKIRTIQGLQKGKIKDMFKPMYDAHRNLYNFLAIVDKHNVIIEDKDIGTIDILIERLKEVSLNNE